MPSTSSQPGFFSRFPFTRRDMLKLVPMSLMLFFICFNYSLLRNLKDTIVVTTSGAEVIPFIKVWFTLPMAVILAYLFTKLSNRFTQEHVFYIMISGFLSTYAIFAFVLYPIRDTIHPYQTVEYLQGILPAGFSGLLAAVQNWSFTIFYVMCELWSSIVLNVIFWVFANEVTKVSEARYYYSVLGVFSNLAAFSAGSLGIYFSKGDFNPNLPFGNNEWEQSLVLAVSIAILLGIITMLIFRWMNCKVLKDPEYDAIHQVAKPLPLKKKMSIRESFRFLSQSKYLLCIAAIVVAYNFSINVVEVIWKDQLRMLCPDPREFHIYLNEVTRMVGIVSTLMSLNMAWMIGRFGWTWTALITPVTLCVTTAGFFIFMFWQNELAEFAFALTGMTPLVIAVFFGGAHNTLSKAMKYSVFDGTKEMTFIPLDHEVKLKGKAAIDGIGSRFGKSGGSAVLQGFLMVFASLGTIAPYIALILLGVIFMWIIAVKSLGKQFAEFASVKDTQLKPAYEAPQATVA